MTGLVFAGIAPHGFSIIAELAGNELELFQPTREAMEELGKRLMEKKPETIIILTPHGLRLKGYNAIYTSEYCKGFLAANGNRVQTEFKCDKELAEAILQDAVSKGIPCVGANYGALSGEASNIEMDWGTLIPLWYMGAREEERAELVVIGPTREIPLTELVELGKVIANQAEKSGKRVALIASADQGHAHDPEGIYGYDTAAEEYDSWIQELVRENQLERLLGADLEWVERAKPDSLWQMSILYGASTIVPLKGELLSYQLPTYFGMLVAVYEVV